MKLLIALFFATSTIVAAQSQVEVPHKMQFADLTLTIRDDARKEIQKDVDAFVRYPKSFLIKAERARTYFPIIEKIFAEENVPDDIKFLAIQESALISDAVSTSNAVGFWQFKDFTAIEMGLRVDKEVDERLNIVSSTRAAARYFKKNNTFFDNWLFALQAYQMGAGGVMRSEKHSSKAGGKHMEITSSTYWYVKKYLAHKIAYEGAVSGPGEISIVAFQTSNKQSLRDVAREVKVDEAELVTYNKWAKSGMIPGDRTYTVAIPVKGSPSNIKLPQATASAEVVQTTSKRIQETPRSEDRIKINGITAIKAFANETPTTLATRSGLELSAFLKYNDLSISDRIYPGQFYLLGKKRNRGDESYHKVIASDNLWIVSQKYGVQIRKLKRYNRIKGDADLRPGMTLWLSAMKPKDADKLPSPGNTIEVDRNETFAWSTDPVQDESNTVVVSASTEPMVIPVTEVSADTTTAIDTTMILVTPSPLPDNSGKDTVTVAKETVIPVEEVKTEHMVQQGETLYGIAKLYKVGVMDLVTWNSLNLQDGIKPGQILKLSDPQAIAQPTRQQEQEYEAVEHEVKPTDTVYSISRKYSVTIKELMEWNNKKDFTLSVGEKLRILKK
jgi:membrane-bound lytic murein transglycosylase D